MIDRQNQRFLLNFAIVVGIFFILDLLTIITNFFIAPYLDGYGLPDILIYLKTFVFLFLLIILLIWLNNKHYKLTKANFKVIVYVSLVAIIAYFLSLYMYKYLLLLDTSDIILNKILYGNPALIYDFSAQNYKTISYITTIFSGFNSELILFIEGLVILGYYIKIDQLQITEEPKHLYDAFLFDRLLFPLFILLIVSSFISINIFVYKYDIYESFEMGIAITAFILVIPGLITSFKIFNKRGLPCTQSDFRGWHKLLIFISIISIILFTTLFIIGIIYFAANRGSYRIVSTFVSVVISIVIFIRIKKTMSLENK